MNDTTTLSYHPYILCHFAATYTNMFCVLCAEGCGRQVVQVAAKYLLVLRQTQRLTVDFEVESTVWYRYIGLAKTQKKQLAMELPQKNMYRL